jgi:hypothetical protein
LPSAEITNPYEFLYGLVLLAVFIIMMRFMYKTGMRELRAMVMANRKTDENDWTNDNAKEKKAKPAPVAKEIDV